VRVGRMTRQQIPSGNANKKGKDNRKGKGYAPSSILPQPLSPPYSQL
jgi:hypothetical protein